MLTWMLKAARSASPRGLFALLALVAFTPRTLHADPLALVEVANGLQYPVWVGAPEGERERLFVIEQLTAQIRVIRNGTLLAEPLLDLGDEAFIPAFLGDERGLLAMTFHPDFHKNGFIFVHYNNKSGTSVVERYKLKPPSGDLADPDSDKLIFLLPQPVFNHNGGSLEFGPDGYLYLGFGDGGGFGDPNDLAQDPLDLHGKILRIDVDTPAAVPYEIPADNPFANANDPGGLILDEIWASGLRNPWRFSFDRETGDLYIGDVGEQSVEEVDVQPAASSGGENYGWRLKEGSQCFEPASGCDPGGLTEPVYEYTQNPRCAVTGGHVYRGCAHPGLSGRYFFGDYCSAEVFSFVWDGNAATDFQDHTNELDPVLPRQLDRVSSFGVDGLGELYVVDLGDGDDGQIFKIVEGTELACQDSVVEPVRPKKLTLKPDGQPLVSSLRVKVTNADPVKGAPAGAEIQLVASDGSCPPGTVDGAAVFGRDPGSEPGTTVLRGGRSNVARLPIRIDPADHTTRNRAALPRCRLQLAASAPSNDPNPSNDTVEVELEIRDRSDPELAAPAESSVNPAKRVKMVIRPGESERARVVPVKLQSGDAIPESAMPGHAIAIAGDDGSCPPGTIDFVDADASEPGMQASVVVAGGRRVRAEVGVRVSSVDFETPDGKSPARCVAELTAGAGADSEPSNDVTRLVIDVIDRNDF